MTHEKIIQELLFANIAAKEQMELIAENLKSGKLIFPKKEEKYETLFIETFNSTIENLEKAIGDGRKFLAEKN